MSQPDFEPTIRDVGLDLDSLARLARVGMVFDEVVTLDDPRLPIESLPSGINRRAPIARLRLTGSMQRLYQAFVADVIPGEAFGKALCDARLLPTDSFALQYPEYGPYESQ